MFLNCYRHVGKLGSRGMGDDLYLTKIGKHQFWRYDKLHVIILLRLPFCEKNVILF